MTPQINVEEDEVALTQIYRGQFVVNGTAVPLTLTYNSNDQNIVANNTISITPASTLPGIRYITVQPAKKAGTVLISLTVHDNRGDMVVAGFVLTIRGMQFPLPFLGASI